MKIIAHRGFSAGFPENSRLAYEKAIQAGCDIIETDARLTLDGHIVSCHDLDFGRISGLKKPVENLTASEISRIDLGDGQYPMFLPDVLKLAIGRVGVLIDVKTTDIDTIDAVAELISKHGENVDIFLGMRNTAQLEYLAELGAAATLVALPKTRDEIPNFIGVGAQVIRVWEEDLGHSQAQQLLSGSIPVWVTTGQRSRGEKAGEVTPLRLQEIKNLGVQAALVNDPSMTPMPANQAPQQLAGQV